MSSLKAQADYVNENYSDCLKQMAFEMKKTLTTQFSSQLLASGGNLLQQLNVIATTNTLNFNNNNDLVLYLLKTTQSLTNWLDSIPPSLTNLQANTNTTIFFNNIALVHHSIQKHSLSSLYFQRALAANAKFIDGCLLSDSQQTASETDENKSDSNNNHLNLLLTNRSYELTYNLGISLLFSKQPVAAFECLFKVTKIYGQNARLWLRIAECCIMCYRHSVTPNVSLTNETLNDLQKTSLDSNLTASNNEKILKLSEKIKCIQRSFGSGYHHKIQFGTNLTSELPSNTFNLNEMKKIKQEDSQLMARCVTLEFAYMCLHNSLKIIPTSQQIFTSNATKGPGGMDLLSQFKSKLNPKQSNLAEHLDDEGLDGVDNDFEENTNSSNDQQSAENVSTSNPGESTTSDLSPKSFMNKQSKPFATAHSSLFNCVWPSKPLNLSELQNLRSSILISLSYVSLCLKDYSNTVKYCNILLANDDLLNLKCPISKGNK